MARSARSDPQRNLLLAGAAFVLAVIFWQVPGLAFVTYPLRLFVTLIHELAHGIAALLTGGEFVELRVMARGAGVAYTRGGTPALIIPAGYLGTALFGAALLWLTHRTGSPRRVAIALGLALLALTLLHAGVSAARLSLLELGLPVVLIGAGVVIALTRDADAGKHWPGLIAIALGAVLLLIFAAGSNRLTVAVGLGAAALLIAIGGRASREVVIISLTFLALITGLQAITDAWTLFTIVSLPESMMPMNDASAMARAVGGTAGLWAAIWILLDVIIFGAAVYWALIRPARRAGAPIMVGSRRRL